MLSQTCGPASRQFSSPRPRGFTHRKEDWWPVSSRRCEYCSDVLPLHTQVNHAVPRIQGEWLNEWLVGINLFRVKSFGVRLTPKARTVYSLEIDAMSHIYTSEVKREEGDVRHCEIWVQRTCRKSFNSIQWCDHRSLPSSPKCSAKRSTRYIADAAESPKLDLVWSGLPKTDPSIHLARTHNYSQNLHPKPSRKQI